MLKNAKLNDIENILRPIGSFKKKAYYVKNIASLLFDKYDCKVPVDREELITFPGVGRKTINVFLSEFYQMPAIGVDTHVERVSKRLKLAYLSDNVLTVEKKLMRKFPPDRWAKLHLQLVLFGRYYCKAINPLCNDCRLSDICRKKRRK